MKQQDKYDLIGQRNIRIEKAQKLREMGIDPYPSQSNRNKQSQDVINNYDELENSQVTVAGRVMSWREHGSLIFSHIQDQQGRIQLYIREDSLADTSSTEQRLGFSDLGLLDVGDIIEATGKVTKTQKGEISILPEKIKILTKSLRPLPDKWSGLKDQEKIFRQRYLDTIMNPDHRWRFAKTAELVFAIREFLNAKGFLEIKTPILQPLYGGGMAKPFTTKVNALNVDYYMAISHELYLKRLITAGFDNVYNIAGYFRNEGIDRTHNPEFQMLETMSAYNNYEYNMNLIEEMYAYISNKVFNKTKFMVNEQEVDFGNAWERMDMLDAVKKYTEVDFNQIKELETAHKVLGERSIDARPTSIGEAMVALFEAEVEEKLIQPTFITGHPVEISPLAKKRSDDPRFVERFEIFIGGIEGGDNWTELNDPLELYERFKDQVDKRAAGDDEAHPMDVDFLEMMEYGMPPTTGLGPGIERLAMMMTETEYIDDVLFFPMLKPAAVTSTQKEIYGEEYLATDKKSKTQDLDNKIVIVLNKELEGWQLTNTISHIAGFIGSKIGESDFVSQESFETKEGSRLFANSQYGIVTLTAKPGQMYNLLQKVEEHDLIHLAYTQDMIDHIDDKKLSEVFKEKNKPELEYLGIGFYGSKEILDQLTKKFSLYK